MGQGSGAGHRFKIQDALPGLVLAAGSAFVFGGLLLADKPWEVAARDAGMEKIQSFAAFYGWWAGLANAVLLLLLAVTAKWWTRAGAAAGGRWLPDLNRPRWFWPMVGAAVAICAVFGGARIGQSLWDDEDTSVRLYIHGEWKMREDGSLRFRQPSWEETFFNYRRPTNHHLQSIFSRLGDQIWQAVARPGGLRLNEPAMRVPILLAAMGSILVVAGLLRRAGFPRAAVVAAFLLALHPWHVRYAIELRGYMFAMFFVPLLLWALLVALEKGGWGRWAAFAACSFAALYSHPGTFYAVVLANACAPLAILLRNRGGGGAVPGQLTRWFVVTSFAGMLYLQLMAPCLPQLSAYLVSERSLGALTPRWRANVAAHFFAGVPWNNSDSASAGFPELKWVAETAPAVFWPIFWFFGLAALAGLARLAFRRPGGWVLALSFALPPAGVYLQSLAKGNYLYEWYLIWVLPGLICCCACGLDWIAGVFGKAARFAPAIFLAASVGVFFGSTQFARGWLLARSIQPMRESVLAIRPSLDPFEPAQKGVITARLSAPVRSYDPQSLGIATMETFLGTMQLADESGRPLYVNYGNLHAAAFDYPEILAMIEDDRLFEKVSELRGYDPSLDRFIRKYRPGSLGSYPGVKR